MSSSPRPPIKGKLATGKTTKAQAKATAKATRQASRRHISRHQRDMRLQRITKIGFAAVLILVVAIIGVGYWREQIAPGTEAILRVRGVPISTQTYAKVLGWQQFQLDQQMANLQSFAGRQGNDPTDQSAALVQQYVQQQLSQLQQQRASLDSQVLALLINDELVRQEAAKRGIAVTPADQDAEIVKEQTPATPVPATTPAPGTDQSAPTPAASAQEQPAAEATPTQPPAQPTPTPRSPQQILADTRTVLGQSGILSDAEYRELIVTPQILSARLQSLLAEEVPATADQVWARHILVDTADTANDALAKLQGGADFAALASDLSTDTGSKIKGGDLGWFTLGSMTPPFESAAFSLQVGETVTAPVQSTYGYHIIQVLGRENDRPLGQEQLQTAKDGALNSWLSKASSDDPKAVEYGYTSERLQWARNWVSNNAKYLQQPKK